MSWNKSTAPIILFCAVAQSYTAAADLVLHCLSACVSLSRSFRHFFHKGCVDPWLIEHRTCPICKLDILQAYGIHVRTYLEASRIQTTIY